MYSLYQLVKPVLVLLLVLMPGAICRGIDRQTNRDAETEIHIPRIIQPPNVEDFLSDPSAGAVPLAHVQDFIQQQPSDGEPATQNTDVYLGYDSAQLYVVWVCHDKHPGAVRAHLSGRDVLDPTQIYNDDFVEVTLDTFQDRRHGFVFASNALGIQTDALWTEDAQFRDTTWDEQWDTKAKLTSFGYIVWMAIPFRSLRFPRASRQSWGITLERYQARRDEIDYWPRVSSRISGKLNQEGAISDLENITPSSNIQFTPYTYVRRYRAINDIDPAAPYYESVNAQGRFGTDFKWVSNDSMVLDATVNPDFSQLESDEPQNTVNRRFAVFYPEKRPFFLENSNFFDSAATSLGLSQLVFTRNIADPGAGIKLSGKRGPWDIGLLAASDRSSGEVVPPWDADYHKEAYFAIGRVTHDFGKQSNGGFLYADRELNGGFNRVGAADLSLRINSNWTGYFREAISSTRCGNGSALCLSGQTEFSEQTPIGYQFGSNGEASLNGSGRRFSLTVQYQDITSAFHTDSGYVPRTDIRNLQGYYHYYFRPEGKRLINWGFETNLARIRDHRGEGTSYVINGAAFFGFRRNTKFWFPIVTTQSDTIRPQDFAGLPANRKFVQNGMGIDFRTAPFNWFSFNTIVYRQGTIALVVPAGQVPVEGDEVTINSTLTIKPLPRLQINNIYILDRVTHQREGHAVFDNNILRSEITYQQNQRLGVRIIPQYNGLLANQQYSSLMTTRDFNVDFLITYLIHPGTAFYLGYNSDLANVSPTLCIQVPETSSCDPNGGLLYTSGRLRNDSRQIFFKLSYNLRR